jgi:hypothetical protein
MMPLIGIQLLFATLVHCTRVMCKCEKSEIGSKVCNQGEVLRREPADLARGKSCCVAKCPWRSAAMLDSARRAS